MAKRNDELYQPSVLQWIICYIVWICLAIASILLILQVRSNLITPIFLLPIDPRTLTVINQSTIFVFGIVGLIAILVMEYFLRTGVAKKAFWPRVARLIVILAVLLGVSYAVQILAMALMTT